MHKWHVGWPRKFLRMLGSNQAIKQEEDEHPHKGLKSTIHDIRWSLPEMVSTTLMVAYHCYYEQISW